MEASAGRRSSGWATSTVPRGSASSAGSPPPRRRRAPADMDPVEGVDASPAPEPESRPPDEAEAIIRAASPWRLAARVVLVLLVLGAVGGVVWALHHRATRLQGRSAPMSSSPPAQRQNPPRPGGEGGLGGRSAGDH